MKHCNGQTIQSDMGLLRFCLPRPGMKVTREPGEHGEMHHSLRVRHRGRPYVLLLVFGPYFTGRDPSGGNRSWSSRVWQRGNLSGVDYVLRRDSTTTRYVTLNAMMGFAEYREAPPEVARRFDRILDSMCCGE